MENFDDKYKKKNPFTVPEGYFDELTGRITGRIEKQKEDEKFNQDVRNAMDLFFSLNIGVIGFDALKHTASANMVGQTAKGLQNHKGFNPLLRIMHDFGRHQPAFTAA